MPQEPKFYRLFDYTYEVVFKELVDLLVRRGFDVRHCDPFLGLVLAHRPPFKNKGHYEFFLTRQEDGVALWMSSGDYTLWDPWHYEDLQEELASELEELVPFSHSAADTAGVLPEDGKEVSVAPGSYLDGYYRELDTPTMAFPAALALANGLVFYILFLANTLTWANLLVVLFWSAPFFLGAALYLSGLYRVGAALTMVVGVILDLVLFWLFSPITLLFTFGAYWSGMKALHTGHWQTWRGKIDRKRAALSGPRGLAGLA